MAAGISTSTKIGDVLHKLGLIVDGHPIQAAVVAFGQNLLPWYPQCSLRLARFNGTTKDEFVDQRRMTGHAFELFDQADKFIRTHTPISGTFTNDSMKLHDKPLYPVLAVREAMISAICHRDHSRQHTQTVRT